MLSSDDDDAGRSPVPPHAPAVPKRTTESVPATSPQPSPPTPAPASAPSTPVADRLEFNIELDRTIMYTGLRNASPATWTALAASLADPRYPPDALAHRFDYLQALRKLFDQTSASSSAEAPTAVS